MLSIRLATIAVLSAAVSSSAPELRVLRTSASDAQPDEPITVTFDRPVAGGLDATVDAKAWFGIDPAVPGRVEWRDPVTLRFTPSQPLARKTTYRVTIAAGLTGMDGSRLSAPYTFEVRPPGAGVLQAWSPDGFRGLHFLPARPRFRVLVAAEADAGDATRLMRVDFPQGRCVVPHTVGVQVTAQRAPTADELKQIDNPYGSRYEEEGPPPRPAAKPDTRRVLELVPAAALPPGCSGSLVLPQRVDEGSPAGWRLEDLSVRGPFAFLKANCGNAATGCAFGPAYVEFSTPVTGAEVLRHVRLEPGLKFTVYDTAEASATWNLNARMRPRQHYAVVVDTLLEDIYGSRLAAVGVKAFATEGIPATVEYEYGRLLVERRGLGTLAVMHVNVDTLHVMYAQVPDSMEAAFLAQPWGGWRDAWEQLKPLTTTLKVPVRASQDQGMVTGVRVPVRARGAMGGTLVAVRVAAGARGFGETGAPIALVQVTDLAVQARIGTDQGVVWVTGVADGLPRAGAAIELKGRDGRVRARGRTGADGLATLTGFRADTAGTAAAGGEGDECEGDCGTPDQPFDGYVVATLAEDRAVVGVTRYDPDFSPWRFGVSSAWGASRWPVAAAVFTERGIYRPGETVHAKAIARTGPLGALVPPGARDSIKLVFLDREEKPLLERTLPPSRFGTVDAELRVPPEAPLGSYRLRVQMRRGGGWLGVADAWYTVAEYRPPEFLVDAVAPQTPIFAGDTLKVNVSARYLFGAPMGRAPVRWSVQREPAWIWEHEIPGLDESWTVGGGGWWDEDYGAVEGSQVLASGEDTLDLGGHALLKAVAPKAEAGKVMRVTLGATVVDANRQTVSAAVSALVHPSDFYIAARTEGSGWVVKAGNPITVSLLAVRPDGRHLAGAELKGALVRREWHRVRRYRGDEVQEIGEFVSDTAGTCTVRSADAPVACTLTPQKGGEYELAFSGKDARGRNVATSLARWVTGPGFVPWDDETKLKLQLVPDKRRYTVGDTATIVLAAPFTDAEAWITVERERVLEQRRMRVAAGSVALRFPITEALVPNAYVSVLIVRGRSAKPGPLDDPGRPTLRVGYADLRVTPERKRLSVEVKPAQAEYRPGDTARVAVHVRDASGRGVASEVTLWAVDEGVLSLTGYKTPDPLDLLYRERGLGMRLASNLATVAPQVPDGPKGGRSPGGSGGRDLNGILRSKFRPTAFFLASVVTDANGDAVAAGALPDNLTTFRVMAVAVTAGDRYGSGQGSLLATRPLVARPALPRFAREGDRFRAGVVVNQRAGGTPKVRVVADATGVKLEGSSKQETKLEAGRGAELRFGFQALAGDSATFRFDATGAGDADAVRVAIPIKPPYHPVVHTVAGVVHDTATVEIELPDELDPARSTLRLGVGSSPLATIAGYARVLQIYPYLCSEQLASSAGPMIALYRAQKETGVKLLRGDAAAEITRAIGVLSRRQGANGAIGFWGPDGWSTPWLSAYAGRVLLDARDAGFSVSDAVLSKLAEHLRNSLHNPPDLHVPVAAWYQDNAWMELSDRAAAADFLSRMKQPDVAAENQLVGSMGRMAWEDRLLLGEILARRGQSAAAAAIVNSALAGVRVEGRKAVLPAASAHRHYFPSQARPYARAVTALLAVDPNSPLLGPLVEALIDRGRLAALAPWNTHDYGSAALALARVWRRQANAGPRTIRLLDGSRTLLQATARASAPSDTAIPLTGLVHQRSDGARVVRVTVAADGGGAPVYFDVNVTEVPRGVAVNPRQTGLQVERWYERIADGKPIVSVKEGEVVRVRLRVSSDVEREFVVLDDPLPAGLEPIDLSLRTFAALPEARSLDLEETESSWWYGSWDSGFWTPWDHKEMRDDRVIYSAAVLWRGTFSASYLARATTAGAFAMPAAHAEEMYNPGVHGRSGGGVFTVSAVK